MHQHQDVVPQLFDASPSCQTSQKRERGGVSCCFIYERHGTNDCCLHSNAFLPVAATTTLLYRAWCQRYAQQHLASLTLFLSTPRSPPTREHKRKIKNRDGENAPTAAASCRPAGVWNWDTRIMRSRSPENLPLIFLPWHSLRGGDRKMSDGAAGPMTRLRGRSSAVTNLNL